MKKDSLFNRILEELNVERKEGRREGGREGEREKGGEGREGRKAGRQEVSDHTPFS